jgi:hypothetical protein
LDFADGNLSGARRIRARQQLAFLADSNHRMSIKTLLVND